jgi:ATP-binding protein involved in chromosome partitioning
MSIHICSECGHAEHIFGSGGGERMAGESDVDMLGALPLDISIRIGTDEGKPSVAADPEGKIATIYRDIARNIAAKLAKKTKDHSSAFPNIVIQNN